MITADQVTALCEWGSNHPTSEACVVLTDRAALVGARGELVGRGAFLHVDERQLVHRSGARVVLATVDAGPGWFHGRRFDHMVWAAGRQVVDVWEEAQRSLRRPDDGKRRSMYGALHVLLDRMEAADEDPELAADALWLACRREEEILTSSGWTSPHGRVAEATGFAIRLPEPDQRLARAGRAFHVQVEAGSIGITVETTHGPGSLVVDNTAPVLGPRAVLDHACGLVLLLEQQARREREEAEQRDAFYATVQDEPTLTVEEWAERWEQVPRELAQAHARIAGEVIASAVRVSEVLARMPPRPVPRPVVGRLATLTLRDGDGGEVTLPAAGVEYTPGSGIRWRTVDQNRLAEGVVGTIDEELELDRDP